MSGGPGLTPSQTVGPFFHYALLREGQHVLAGAESQGQRIRVEGQVFDGDGTPVPDAMIEIWQANAHGRYHHPADQRALPLDPAFTGFGRCGTDDSGRYWFETVKPGPVPFDTFDSSGERGGEPQQQQAPHILVTVFGRGLLNHLVTRLYFEDDPATQTDPVLQRVPPERRATLIARRVAPVAPQDGRRSSAAGAAGAAGAVEAVYRLDIVLQGEGETVFFDV
jgi:protocatechuate 3,4-dioxygenase, alpha subunit